MTHKGQGFAAIILAAGQGKRMNSPLPKVLHVCHGKPMIEWVVLNARAAGATKIVVIVGHGREEVIAALPAGVETAVQEEQLGTGHAARCAQEVLKNWNGPVAVLSGDVPALRADTLRLMAARQRETGCSCVLLTAKVAGTHAYGRILRNKNGQVKGIVENKDATPEQKNIDEINSGTYVFGPGKLFPTLGQIQNTNAQKEFYLTDAVGILAQGEGRIEAITASDVGEVLGVNTPEELAQAELALMSIEHESATISPGPGAFSFSGRTAMRVFSGNANPKLAQDICKYLDIPLGDAEVTHFPDGESKVRILDDVRGRDVFIVQPTSPPVNDHLMELLVLIDALRRASAARITAVIPYFGYARQDRKHEGRVPITAKLVANLITQAGADRVITVDLHAEQIQGFFDIPLDHLVAMPVQMAYAQSLGLEDLTILSPDLGRTKMTEKFARKLNARLAVIEKRRVGDTEVVKGNVVGEIKNRHALIVDDMISTAGSMQVAVQTALEYGAKSVTVMATHPVFCGRAFERLNNLPVRELCVCNTIEMRNRPQNIQLRVLNVAGLIGEAIWRIHTNASVSGLFV